MHHILKFGPSIKKLIGLKSAKAGTNSDGLGSATVKTTIKTTDQVVDRMLNLNGFG